MAKSVEANNMIKVMSAVKGNANFQLIKHDHIRYDNGVDPVADIQVSDIVHISGYFNIDVFLEMLKTLK